MSNATLTRRELIAGAVATAGVGVSSAPAKAAGRVPIGAAANHFVLPTDASYRNALVRHCDVLVAEGAMKWAHIRQNPDAFDFGEGDRLVAFAEANGLSVRGHTLVWNAANPHWVDQIGTSIDAERHLVNHIERTVAHFGSIRSWDVVNEPIAEKPTSVTDLRDGVWSSRLGRRHIDLAFATAARIAPTQQRVINEYGIEAATPHDRLKRAAFRQLILDLKNRGVPLSAVGIQAHLDGAVAVDTEGVAAFCAEMSRLGLDVLITELDVNDFALPGPIAERDAVVAKRVGDFLGAVFSACRPSLVCTWGLTDRHTWIPMYFKRADGLPNRPLPLDADLKPKPMLQAIHRYCRPT